MRYFLLIALLFQVAPSPGVSGEKAGRTGNALYTQEDYAGAADAYRAGLAAAVEQEDAQALQADLLNNLGAALHQAEDYETAGNALIQSLANAPEDAARARAAYNLGNNQFRQEDLQTAVEFYKRALLADPGNADARFNYEFVKRQLDQQQQQQQQNNEQPPEPSEFAKQLKAQAEALVAQRQYRAAFDLMQDGLRQDPTVRAFQDFIGRTGTVADINEGKPPQQ